MKNKVKKSESYLPEKTVSTDCSTSDLNEKVGIFISIRKINHLDKSEYVCNFTYLRNMSLFRPCKMYQIHIFQNPVITENESTSHTLELISEGGRAVRRLYIIYTCKNRHFLY